jgi:hypothetical protein
MEMTQVLLYGAVGGLLPDLIRIAKARGNLADVGGFNVIISIVVLVTLGMIASWLADSAAHDSTTLISSVTAGFAGPEIISRLVGGGNGGSGGGGGGGASGGGGGATPQSFGTGGLGVTRWWRV